MNNLNSVLIEGMLSSEAYTVNVGRKEAHVGFKLSSVRKNGDDVDEICVRINVRGRLAQTVAARKSIKGSRARVVGRLAALDEWTPFDEEEPLCVEAEHVEFRPELKKEEA